MDRGCFPLFATVLSESLAIILSVILTCASTGCQADKVGDRLAFEVVKHSLGDMGELVACTQMFRDSKRRLPSTYDELREFVSQKYHDKVELPHYDKVDFKQLEDGRVEVDCFVMSQGVTNHTTFAFGGAK